ncbi:MAG: hypothetical protein M0Z69_12050 [Actinomycetota bacterium]|nr:hypothetical protein [Actinomycetota bacterium]
MAATAIVLDQPWLVAAVTYGLAERLCSPAPPGAARERWLRVDACTSGITCGRRRDREGHSAAGLVAGEG